MELWNYCAICGRRIEVGETCYGVTKNGADLVVGDSICRDCIEIENHPNNTETNADRIRSMSDEELAELLTDGCRGSKCSEAPKNEYGSVNCFQCRLNWLIKPADD